MRIIGFSLILLGFFLLFHPQFEKKVADSEQTKLIETFENLGNPMLDEEIPHSTPVIVKEKDQSFVEGINGIIRIPKIELEMVIFEDADQDSLRKGIGMIQANKELGVNNVGLAGHRSTTYGKQFNRLDELGMNDIVEVQLQSSTYKFKVIKTFVVDQTEVEVLNDQSEPLLTLVTCTPIGKRHPTDRLIVQAKLINNG